VGWQAITDFAQYWLAWHLRAQEPLLSTQDQTSGIHALAQLMPELGPVTVPGCKTGPMGRDPFLWQQYRRSLMHLRGM